MSTNNKNWTFTNNSDDTYKDVLSALSQLDDSADIDYVKENYKFEQKRHSQRRLTDFRPLRHAAKFLQCLIQKKCA